MSAELTCTRKMQLENRSDFEFDEETARDIDHICILMSRYISATALMHGPRVCNGAKMRCEQVGKHSPRPSDPVWYGKPSSGVQNTQDGRLETRDYPELGVSGVDINQCYASNKSRDINAVYALECQNGKGIRV